MRNRLDPPPGVNAQVVGLPVLAAEANAKVSSDWRRLLAVLGSLLLVSLALLAVYRRPERALVPARPDRARRRLVGARALRHSGAAEPDVGHPRRAGGRHLDRVQRPALAALPPGADRRLSRRRGPGPDLPVHRGGGGRVRGDGDRRVRRPRRVRHPDAAGLRLRHGGRPRRVAARRAPRPAGGARARRAGRAAVAARAGVATRAQGAARARCGACGARARPAHERSRARPARLRSRRTRAADHGGAGRAARARARHPAARRPGADEPLGLGGGGDLPRLARLHLASTRCARTVPARAAFPTTARSRRSPCRSPCRTSRATPTSPRGPTRAGRGSGRRARCGGRRSSTPASSPSAGRSCSPSMPRARGRPAGASSSRSSGCASASPASSSPRWRIRGNRGDLRDLIRDSRLRYPVGYDHDGQVANLYRVAGCPTMTFAYPGGIVMHTYLGLLDEARLAAAVRRLVTGSERRGWRPPKG